MYEIGIYSLGEIFIRGFIYPLNLSEAVFYIEYFCKYNIAFQITYIIVDEPHPYILNYIGNIHTFKKALGYV